MYTDQYKVVTLTNSPRVGSSQAPKKADSAPISQLGSRVVIWRRLIGSICFNHRFSIYFGLSHSCNLAVNMSAGSANETWVIDLVVRPNKKKFLFSVHPSQFFQVGRAFFFFFFFFAMRLILSLLYNGAPVCTYI